MILSAFTAGVPRNAVVPAVLVKNQNTRTHLALRARLKGKHPAHILRYPKPSPVCGWGGGKWSQTFAAIKGNDLGRQVNYIAFMYLGGNKSGLCSQMVFNW